uniref:NADH dehydrogenase subunit 3 n=1 Tax=Cerogria janthinipennis TaxID=1304780 RepID=UPI0022092117|nr:NADH dehydrogenase subunit 3 [Cerogria janthinipennis]UYB79036.1 NADH dehydrogenase subunit 3 [Cerogria janthinipennis]
MNILAFMFFIISFIMFILIIILNLISKKSYKDREKMSPFECGFDPKSSSRLPFSLHFFLMAILFLIFDVEITILFPMVILMNVTNILLYFISMFFFIIILILGLFHEWNEGSLNWKV